MKCVYCDKEIVNAPHFRGSYPIHPHCNDELSDELDSWETSKILTSEDLHIITRAIDTELEQLIKVSISQTSNRLKAMAAQQVFQYQILKRKLHQLQQITD